MSVHRPPMKLPPADTYGSRMQIMVQETKDWLEQCDFGFAEIAKHAGITRQGVKKGLETQDWDPQASTLIGICHARDVLEKQMAEYEKHQMDKYEKKLAARKGRG